MTLFRLPRIGSILSLAAATLSAQAAWTRLYPSAAPSLRQGHAMAFDPVNARVVLFGGSDQQFENDLWSWDGSLWHQVVTVGGPSPRMNHGLVCDSIRNRVVLFGGYGGSGDTWEWNGSQWLARTPAHHPSPRDSFAMAFDSQRGRVVLFGGQDNNQVFFGDTWVWDGTDWTQLTPTASPLARRQGQLAFDGANGVCVLFGGQVGVWNANQIVNDTWTWDGSAWQLRQPAHMPAPSANHKLTYDAARARVVGHGFGNFLDSFSWEWDGQDWHIVLLASPGPSIIPLAYDAARRQVLGYGIVFQVYANHGDTWTYSTSTPASYGTYGAGCPGSVGTPTLTNAPYSMPWLGDTFTARAGNLAPSVGAVIFVTGLSSTPPQDLTSLGMPGCFGLLSPLVAETRVANAGSADWVLAIPNVTSLAGAQLFQQALVLEPGSNLAGMVVSNGAQLIAGIR
jgi:hypothetical protein